MMAWEKAEQDAAQFRPGRYTSGGVPASLVRDDGPLYASRAVVCRVVEAFTTFTGQGISAAAGQIGIEYKKLRSAMDITKPGKSEILIKDLDKINIELIH